MDVPARCARRLDRAKPVEHTAIRITGPLCDSLGKAA